MSRAAPGKGEPTYIELIGGPAHQLIWVSSIVDSALRNPQAARDFEEILPCLPVVAMGLSRLQLDELPKVIHFVKSHQNVVHKRFQPFLRNGDQLSESESLKETSGSFGGRNSDVDFGAVHRDAVRSVCELLVIEMRPASPLPATQPFLNRLLRTEGTIWSVKVCVNVMNR